MNDKKDRLDFTITLNNVTYFIACYRSSIQETETFEQTPHLHFDMEFHYIYGGTEMIYTTTKENAIALSSGQMAFIPKKVYHGSYTNATVDRICFCLNAEYNANSDSPASSNYYRVYDIFEYFQDIQILSDANIVSLMSIYRNICIQSRHFINHQKGILLASVAMRLLELLNAKIPAEFRSNERNYSISSMNRRWIIEEHICRNYDKLDGISALSGALHLSERQTRAFIKKEFNSTYKKMIIKQRMDVANILFQDEGQSLEKIAELVGYQSYSGFYVAYSNFFGISPEEARKKILQKNAI